MGHVPSCKYIIKQEIQKGKFSLLSMTHTMFKLLGT